MNRWTREIFAGLMLVGAILMDSIFGDKCLNGTRNCWGRCHRCILKRIEEENRQKCAESLGD